MIRILIVECKQEVSTFNPALSCYDDFVIHRGEGLIAYHRTVRNEVGGVLSVFDQHPEIAIVPAISARAITSGGTLAAADWTRLRSDILAAIRDTIDTTDTTDTTDTNNTTPIHAAYFALHGAMAAENEDDPEGELLQEARRLLGPHTPIVASFDLHGILTDRILRNADAICCFHTYPHVDFYETGQRAARLLLRVLNGAKPVTAKVFIPALVRGDELITATGAIRHAVNAAKSLEANGALSAGLFWGNPFTDVPDLATYSFVVTDDDPALAEREALRVAELFWCEHEKMRVPLTPLDEAVRIAQEQLSRGGTTILVDAADATSSGASGDSNTILRQLIATGYPGRALIPIVDPPAARAAFDAGVGATVTVRVGGAMDPGRFTPVEVTGRVHLLSEGEFRSESFDELWYSGPTAVLIADNITLVITSRAVSLYDRSLFYAHGQDPKRFDLVVVKSPHCQPHMFKDWAARYVDVDAPGATSANLKRLGHTRCPRPIWPLDEQVTWERRAVIFRRSTA
ncbi:MAG: M81 family metallopeptidase [Candidatus Brachytrichaceae bacterium NZ_4S206]|jgi:microcystin degradation protein MlrC